MADSITPRDALVEFLAASSLLERRSDEFFRTYELSPAQFNILNLLSNAPDGGLPQSQLIDGLLVGKATVSILLSKMVRAGLIQRIQSTKDRRRFSVALSPKGRRIWEKASPAYEATVKTLFADYSPKRLRRLRDEMTRLQQAIEKTAASPKAAPKK